MGILDATPEKIGAIKSKAEYIADVVMNILSDGRTIPATVADDVLSTLESIADTIGEYNDWGGEY